MADFESKGRQALLVSVQRSIDEHERNLIRLRETEKHLICRYERLRWADLVDELRALVVNYEKGLLDEF